MDKNQLPLISIVFTSYNHIEYLKQALDSLVNQTYPNFEIIIVDDCSTDGSQNLLQQYKHHSNIKLKLNEINSGSYVKASNFGASFADGDFILFAQCDDYAAPNQLMELYAPFMKYPNVGVVYSRSRLVDKDSQFISDDYSVRESKFRKKCVSDTIISGKEMCEFLSFSCVIPNLSAALIKKEVFLSVGMLSDKYIVAADWGLWLSITKKCDFYYLTECLNNFRQHATTIRSSVKIQVHVTEIYDIFYDHIDSYNLKGSERDKLRVGAGAVWFWYFYNNKVQWFKAFSSMLKNIQQRERLSIYYFILGAFKQVKEAFSSKK